MLNISNTAVIVHNL